MFETVIHAGERTPLHTHLVPHLVIFGSGSQFVRRDETDAITFDTRAADPPSAIPVYSWSDGLSAHTLENTGTDDLTATSIEIKP